MAKFEVNAQVLSQKMLADQIWDMTLKAPEVAKHAVAGQFVSLYCKNAGKLLPRPISICDIDTALGTIRLVYRVTKQGSGTEEFSSLKAGDTIRMIGPLGNGFFVDKKYKKALLIGGGIGVPPMLALAKEIKNENAPGGGTPKIEFVMGYRDCHTFLADEFEKEATLFIASEDGSIGTKGNVLDAIFAEHLSADVIYACGPTPMLRAIKQYAKEQKIDCFISLEERMACGIGACLACVCKTNQTDAHSNVNNARICKDGPVFAAEEVSL